MGKHSKVDRGVPGSHVSIPGTWMTILIISVVLFSVEGKIEVKKILGNCIQFVRSEVLRTFATFFVRGTPRNSTLVFFLYFFEESCAFTSSAAVLLGLKFCRGAVGQ